MRTIMLVGVVIIVLVLGKLFVFSKPGRDSGKDVKKGGDGKNVKSSGGGAVPVNVYVVGRESIENQIFASGVYQRFALEQLSGKCHEPHPEGANYRKPSAALG